MNKGHVWVCSNCMPKEPVEELLLGRFFATKCYVCSKVLPPSEMHCVYRSYGEFLKGESPFTIIGQSDPQPTFPKEELLGCIGCRFQEPKQGGFCYMFEKRPEKLPCAQYERDDGAGR